MCSDRLAALRDLVFHKVGEDWIFLTILGVVMAVLSFCMDYIIEKCQEGGCASCLLMSVSAAISLQEELVSGRWVCLWSAAVSVRSDVPPGVSVRKVGVPLVCCCQCPQRCPSRS